LGLREGATENASRVSALLHDLAVRGLDFSVSRLYVLDGGKALAAAVRRHAGEAALIQRCQVHKRRNVIDHLPEEHKPSVKKKLQNAYAMTERWVGSGLLVAERQFRKVQGYREIPSLLTSLANTVSKKAVAEEVKVA
jgi:hypothetical protein